MIYGNALLMGISPPDLEKMTMWQYVACLHRWNAAQRGTNPDVNWTEEGLENLDKLRDMWNGAGRSGP